MTFVSSRCVGAGPGSWVLDVDAKLAARPHATWTERGSTQVHGQDPGSCGGGGGSNPNGLVVKLRVELLLLAGEQGSGGSV